MKRFLLVFVVVFLFSSLFSQVLERNETMYYGGSLWSPPSNWNPFTPWNAVPGTTGLVYETMFFYDPLTGNFDPWLAEKGEWLDSKTYRVVLREGIYWHDNVPLTSEDVRFTFEIAKKYKGIHYSSVWEWLDHIETPDNRTVIFVFKDPRYHEWNELLYTLPIVPKHIWEGKDETTILQSSNEYPLGSGPYVAHSWDQNKMIFERFENWWGTKVMGVKPAPKYVVIVRVLSNNVALGMLMKGELDFSNFMLPGVPILKKVYNLNTWYDEPPYHLSSTVVGLFLNARKYPLSLPEFRRAIAMSINVDPIVQRVYEGAVLKADPLGFLPNSVWMKYYPKEVVEKYGFKYDPEEAKSILDKLGFRDVNGDGFREAPDGKPIKLTIECPYGWTDWMQAIQVIVDQLKVVGINAEPYFPDSSKYYENMYKGEFDIEMNANGTGISSTPWTYFNTIFYPDALESEFSYTGNYGRYQNPEVESLLEELNRTPLDNVEKVTELCGKLGEILLKDLPFIPLWYGAMAFITQDNVWTNWPNEHNPYAWPCGWANWWQTGALKILFNLKPAK
ncbi:ABC transporter substrate-binding protein [Thermotoga sp. 38H-to]|uniref:ABC transporter substrate-binding protein n=1 Tax=Thermotoga sp. 38H-to TaxID=1755812 RepID=UPI0013EDB76F|nr:ABC transporter substrate-binding protein [Thermotoga sp. 38H-to]KAF2960209.1 ABC transporter substrate-binding protein [Thermotoga sp. 38H-to]